MKTYGTPVPSKRSLEYDFTDKGIFDLHPTPEEFTEALVVTFKLPDRIWEPACGEGHISKRLITDGFRVTSTDIKNWGYGLSGVDFLQQEQPPSGVRGIVTNPPFSIATAFVEKALDFIDAGHIELAAFIMKQEFIGSIDRFERIFSRRMPIQITAIANRMKNSHTGASYSFYHSWYIWTKAKPTYSQLAIIQVGRNE